MADRESAYILDKLRQYVKKYYLPIKPPNKILWL